MKGAYPQRIKMSTCHGRPPSHAGDRYLPVFHGLPQDLENILPELGGFVQEEHAVVGEAYLSWLGNLAAADEPGIRDGAVSGACMPRNMPSRMHPTSMPAFALPTA